MFRDQQFAGDMRSQAVKRIEDVIRLRAAQFREDAGPLAHPVRPADYVEINNFYTATVYEKGAEVIRMLRALVGAEAYRKALDLYFERHDGQACTIEDWLAVFEDSTGRDLTQFKRWYGQAGTPRLSVTEHWEAGRYTLDLAQATKPSPGQAEKAALMIPVAYGLIDPGGATVAEGLLELDAAQQSYSWDLAERPVPSLLRGFSAPVILDRAAAPGERAFLIAHDSDPFNRWEAATAEALDTLARLVDDPVADVDAGYLAALAALADDAALDPAFRALMLGLPSEEDIVSHIAGRGGLPDPMAVYRARRGLTASIAGALGERLPAIHAGNAVPGPYSPDAAAAGRRALRGRALALMTARDPEAAAARASFAAADNMTERMAALSLLVAQGQGAAGAGGVPCRVGRRPAGRRQVVRGAGVADPAGDRGGDGACALRAPGLRLEEPEPVPGAHRRLCRRESGGLPPGGRGGLPAVRRLALPARPGEPADRCADGDQPRDLANVRRGPAAADPGRVGAAGGAAGPLGQYRRDRRQVVARGTCMTVSRLSRSWQAGSI